MHTVVCIGQEGRVKRARLNAYSVPESSGITLTAVNLGPDTAQVTAEVKVAGAFFYSADNGGGRYDHGRGLWQIGRLRPGERACLTLFGQGQGQAELRLVNGGYI